VREKNSNYNFLKDAHRAFKKKRYSEALVLLESIVISKPAEPYPLFLLAVTYLFANKFNRAHGVMDKLRRIDPDNKNLVQLQAFLNLKSSVSIESALAIYVDLIEKYPHNRYLKKGLNNLRGVGDFLKYQKKVKLQKFVEIPPPPSHLKKSAGFNQKRSKGSDRERPVKQQHFRLNFKYTLLFAVIIVVSASLYLTITGKLIKFDEERSAAKIDSSSIDTVNIGTSGYQLINRVNLKKTPEFYYNSKKVTEDFDRSKKLIKAGECNRALLILNRIFNSNANFMVREKADFLIKFVIDLDDRKFEQIDSRKIAEKSYLYRGFAVNWKGRVANLKKKNNSKSFTILVDYRNRDIFSGVASIYSELENNDISNGDMISVRGIFINTLGRKKEMYILAREIEKI